MGQSPRDVMVRHFALDQVGHIRDTDMPIHDRIDVVLVCLYIDILIYVYRDASYTWLAQRTNISVDSYCIWHMGPRHACVTSGIKLINWLMMA